MREHLDIGRVLQAIADLYRNNAAVLLGAALILFLGVALITALLVAASPVLILLALPIFFVGNFWYQAMVIELVNTIHAGRPQPAIGELFSATSSRLGALIGAGILAGLGILVGLVLLVVPGLYLLTIWAVIAPVIVIERARILDSFGRSHQLVRGDGWQVFGILVVIFIINAIFGQIVRAIAGTGFIGGLLGSLIPNVLLAPVGALAAAVIYFELRRIKEGVVAGAAPAAATAPGVAPGPTAPTPPQPAPPPPATTAPPAPPGSTAPPSAPPPGSA